MLVFFNTGFVFVVCNKLVSDRSPILNLAAVPLFVELSDSKIEHFKQRIFAWKCALFGHFAETGVDALDSVCGVHNPSNGATVIIKLFNVAEIAFPYIIGLRTYIRTTVRP